MYDSESRLLEEYDLTTGSAFLLARYFYGSGDAPEAADLYDPSSSQTNRFFFLRDQAESIIAVVDAAGTVVERVWYDPFGQPELEGRDTKSARVKSIVADVGGSLLVELSESVLNPFPDPGAGSGIVPRPPLVTEGIVAVSVNSSNIAGTVELLPTLPGYAPFSVLRFTPSQALPTTPSGLVGWWPADTRVSDVAAGNFGALRGGAALGAGFVQESFTLNGAGAYIEVTNASAFNFGTNDFTVAAWINLSSIAGEQAILEKWDQESGSGWSLTKRSDQRLQLTVGNGVGIELNIQSSAPLTLTSNTWLQVSLRRQGDQFTVLSNGVVVASGNSRSAVNSAATLKFGAHRGTSAFLNGRIDEVTIHNRALSDQELRSMVAGLLFPGRSP